MAARAPVGFAPQGSHVPLVEVAARPIYRPSLGWARVPRGGGVGAAKQVRPHARALRLGDVRWVHVDALAHVAPLVGEDGLLRVRARVRVRVRVRVRARARARARVRVRVSLTQP